MRSSLSQLLSLGSAFEEEFVRLGRLDEGDAVERALARGKYLSMGAEALSWPRSRSARPAINAHTSFHFAHSSVAKPGRVATAPREAPREGRVYVYPGRGETALAREAGALYDRRAGAWWVNVASPSAARLAPLATAAARAAWERGRRNSGRAQAATPAGFQRYVERAKLAVENRAEIEADAAGAISFGSIGESEAERAAFWDVVLAHERSDGRVQCRIIAELPHEVSPAGRRRIAAEFVHAFVERGLPYHATVHLPDPAKGMDPRNVHLHVVYHDRPAERRGYKEWVLAAVKDRAARGSEWMLGLRRRLADAANREIEREDEARSSRGMPAVGRRFDPRSYREMGLQKPPGRHLGPVGAAFERAGRPTPAGAANAVEDVVWEWAERGHAMAPLAERWVEIARRVRVLEALDRGADAGGRTTTPAARLAAELEAARTAIVEAAPRDPGRDERLVQRREWAAAEGRRLDDRITRHELRAAGGGSRRGLISGARLETMRLRRRRLSEIEVEATALVLSIDRAAPQVPLATAALAIASMLGRIESQVTAIEQGSRPRGYGHER